MARPDCGWPRRRASPGCRRRRREVKLVDWEIAAVDFRTEGLLMAPGASSFRGCSRHGLVYADIALWEIHEAFAAQVLAHVRALDSAEFVS